MKKLGQRNFELIADSFRTLGFNDYRDGMMNEEQMYVDEIDEIVAFLKWLHINKMPFGSANYEQSFAKFKLHSKLDKKWEIMEAKKTHSEYIRLLKNFQKAHKELCIFYMEDNGKDYDEDYSHISPEMYPFELSFDDYLQGIDLWIKAQVASLGMIDPNNEQ